ncbi:RNA recognition motif 2-domain-containing protein [Massariosphaeria phaeospora]|uniref:RNA recognition motif 2-domain-containing protein n=1 Tax=Massariosphaeria phaeospora TaxID=100035 RepID=A0A7C8I3F5_9PLEO|nr:RNA recognition motif 2-domain-containing protein [Massariosphaeria phaeospora]
MHNTQAKAYVEGTFLNELDMNGPTYVSRYLFITELPDGCHSSQDQDHELREVQSLMKQYQSFMRAVPVYSRGVYIRFDNARECSESKHELDEHGFHTMYVSAFEWHRAKMSETLSIQEFEGSIKLPMMVTPVTRLFTGEDINELNRIVWSKMNLFGGVRAIAHTATDAHLSIVFYRVEFFSVDAANRAVESLKRNAIKGYAEERKWEYETHQASGWVGPPAAHSPRIQNHHYDDMGRIVGFRTMPVHHVPYINRHPADQHNRVRRERILDGTDVRTTIMLRNIPNKMDWLTLKALLDKFCFATFDFVYLRIDFRTGCNVGYAFINFADTTGMIALMDNIEHKAWPGHRSSKAAEVSYATIQGKEALVQKFRNSSVMQETPFCRPRLFVDLESAIAVHNVRIAGTEQEFPEPDNRHKLQRSIDSARTMGLYPPNGVLQRGRGGLYDRGTPRDLAEASPGYTVLHEQGLVVYDHNKRAIEENHASRFGLSVHGAIPFESIPLMHIVNFLAANPTLAVTIAQHEQAQQDRVPTTYNVGPIGPAVAQHTGPIGTGAIRRPATPATSGSLTARKIANARNTAMGKFYNA